MRHLRTRDPGKHAAFSSTPGTTYHTALTEYCEDLNIAAMSTIRRRDIRGVGTLQTRFAHSGHRRLRACADDGPTLASPKTHALGSVFACAARISAQTRGISAMYHARPRKMVSRLAFEQTLVCVRSAGIQRTSAAGDGDSSVGRTSSRCRGRCPRRRDTRRQLARQR